MIGWAVLLAAIACGVLPSPGLAQNARDRYDHIFRKYSKRYFGVGYDWRVFKAQAMTESGLDASATSRAGARGIMQLMPATYGEIQSKNTDFGVIDDVEWNIAAGILYDRRLWLQWRGDVEDGDHESFTFGSYNAGRTTLLRAQGVARLRGFDERSWSGIVAIAPEVPRWRHVETLSYLDRIRDNLGLLDPRGRAQVGSHPSPKTTGADRKPSN